MELLEMMKNRRSVRQYTGEAVPESSLEQILQAGLYSASGRNRRPWELVVVRDKEMLAKMADCRPHGSGMLAGADCAIVVIGNPELTDVWTEDCSIVMTNMHLMADALGVGSCWIQGRLRKAPDGSDTNDYLRELLHYPEGFQLEAILSLGMAEDHPAPHTADDLLWEKVHREQF